MLSEIHTHISSKMVSEISSGVPLKIPLTDLTGMRYEICLVFQPDNPPRIPPEILVQYISVVRARIHLGLSTGAYTAVSSGFSPGIAPFILNFL